MIPFLFCFLLVTFWVSFSINGIWVNWYKLTFFTPPLLHSQPTKRREIKIFSILLLFYSPIIFCPLTFPPLQSNKSIGYHLSPPSDLSRPKPRSIVATSSSSYQNSATASSSKTLAASFSFATFSSSSAPASSSSSTAAASYSSYSFFHCCCIVFCATWDLILGLGWWVWAAIGFDDLGFLVDGLIWFCDNIKFCKGLWVVVVSNFVRDCELWWWWGLVGGGLPWRLHLCERDNEAKNREGERWNEKLIKYWDTKLQ